MLKKLELSDSDHYILKKFAEEKHIEFLSSPFDIEGKTSTKTKLKKKNSIGEITNLPFLEFVENE